MNFHREDGSPFPFIVAELGCSHSGGLENAKELIHEAKRAGADAVKIQVYTPDDMTLNLDTKDFIVKDGLWKGKKLYDLYEKAQTPYKWVGPLFDYAKSINIPIFSSVFSEKGLKHLEKHNCLAYKIASFEITDLYLIEKVAKTRKPIIVSTGMASAKDIKAVLDITYASSAHYPILLHCISAYPAKQSELSLSRIPYLKKYFGVDVGFSDHTDSINTGAYAVVAGACMIEKHIRLINSQSEDDKFSLDPLRFEEYVGNCRNAYESYLQVQPKGEESSRQFRRSLYVIKDIKEGEKITNKNVAAIRPGYGTSPGFLRGVLGKKAKNDIKKGTPFIAGLVE